jgi:uncharacterized protein YuzE
MRVYYDEKADSIYIEFTDGLAQRTVDVSSLVNVGVADDDRLIFMQIENASSQLDDVYNLLHTIFPKDTPPMMSVTAFEDDD